MNWIQLEAGSKAPPDYFGGVVAVGNFDGVHRGHHRLLAHLRDHARRLNRSAVVVSLHPHPTTLLRPESASPMLMGPDRRAAVLSAAGADRVVFLHSTRELLQLEAGDFFRAVLQEGLGVAGMVEGANFAFGRDRRGTVAELGRMCRDAGVELDVVELDRDDVELVSSSRIRRAIESGEVDAARALTGRPHCLEGVVVHGAERGRLLGFPTANLSELEVVLPLDGVYAAAVELDDGRRFAGACNIGPNPTFAAEERKIEIHLVDFSGDLYGRRLKVDLLRRVRPTQKFSGIDELKDRIACDVQASREAFAAEPSVPPLAELAATAEAWFRDRLRPLDVEAVSATALPDGGLKVRLRPPARPSPHASFEQTFGLVIAFRRTFPEFLGLDLDEKGCGS